MTEPIVIVGGGLAAGTAVATLREQGHEGDIVLFADEPHVPYERPPLSKAFLRGEVDEASTYVNAESWYDAHAVDARPGTTVTGLDLDAGTVQTAAGQTAFSKLLLATGSRARRIPLEPTEHVAVRYLRTLDDATALHAELGPGRRLLVVGGGWIGMEVAASARQLGTEVTLVEPTEQPLLRALGPELGELLAYEHRRQGVDLRVETGLDALVDRTARLSDGTELEVDTVVVGIGAVPNLELATAAGLEVSDGVHVDAGLRTSHPDVFAAGDIAALAHPLLGERVRVEHWQNALSQGRAVARSMLGEPVVYDELPSFFSDQYDWGLEYVGHVGSRTPDSFRIERGDSPSRLTAWWYAGDRLVAAAHVNDWDRSAELAERVRSGR
jgi:3-phenylpropionate/trans-cinnamate dioxygenase ferredoxin reductase subunit